MPDRSPQPDCRATVRVLVASTYVPFIDGGGRMIVRDLVSALRARDHEVDTIEIPFLSAWNTMLEQMLAIRLIDVSDSADVLVAIRTPTQVLYYAFGMQANSTSGGFFPAGVNGSITASSGPATPS